MTRNGGDAGPPAAQRGHHRLDGDWDWSNLLGSGTNPVRAVLLALVIWFVWYFWR